MPDHWGSSDSPGPTVPSPFPTGIGGFFSSDTVRRLVAQAVSSSRRLLASSECFRTGSAPNRDDIQAASRRVHLPWSSRALMTTSVSRIVNAPGLPAPNASASLAFLPPSTRSSTTYLASLFHPAAAFRIHSSRDFPPAQPRHLIDAAWPSCRFPQARCPQLPANATYPGAAFKALLHAEVRCQHDGG